MTSLQLDENQARFQIRSYIPGKIQINEKIYTESLIVAPEQLIENWPPQAITELTAENLQAVIPLKPTIVLIGTGSELHFISPSIYGELINQGIGVEVMTTHSACSTYNALTAENRLVVAALILK